MNFKVHDEDVRAFVQQDRGVFLILSHDPLFNRNLRSTLLRHLHIKEDCVFNVGSLEKLHKMLGHLVGQNHKVVFFVERETNGKYCHDLVQLIRNQYSGVQTIVLTGLVPKEILIYLYEIGASNVITKPISPDMLIEKIAVTVKRLGQIGELIEAGKKFNEKGKFEESASIANKILEIKPGNPAALILLGDSHKGRGKTEDALNVYLEASQGGKLFLDPIKKIADLHKETGNIREETKYLEKLDELSPLNVDRKISIGDNYVSLGEQDKAVSVFDDAIRTAGKEGMAPVSHVTSIIAERCLASAPEISEKYIRQTLEAKKNILGKHDIEAFNRLGLSLRKQGKWSQAIEEYSKALRVSPDDPGLYYNMAMAYTEGNRFQEASEHLDKALQLDLKLWSTNEIICYNIAMVYLRAGRKEISASYLKKVLTIKPDFERAKAALRELSRSSAGATAGQGTRPAASLRESFSV